MSWAGWAIAQPIIWQVFFSIYNSTVEPPHNGHLGDRKKVKVVERFKQESVYGLSAKKVAVVETGALMEIRLYF